MQSSRFVSFPLHSTSSKKIGPVPEPKIVAPVSATASASCITEMNLKSVSHAHLLSTLDGTHDHSKSIIILDHAHILKGKNAVLKIAKPGAVPASAGASTLLQPRVVTRSHWGS